MKALVIYESMFGNTRQVAEAVAWGLHQYFDVATTEVVRAAPDPDADLLLVGGPTHAFGMSRATTRQDAADRVGDAVISDDKGLREWLAAVAHGAGRPAAAFDTRMKLPGLPGSAAKAAVRRLRRRGWRIVRPAESFYVASVEGPLRPGEIERAFQWGESLGRSYLSTRSSRHSA